MYVLFFKAVNLVTLRLSVADLLTGPRIRFKCAELLRSCYLEKAACWPEVKYNCIYIQKQTSILFILTG